MKTTIVAASLSLMGTLALLITTSSEAQQPAATNRTNQTQPGRAAGEQLGALDDQTRGANIRASQLIGMNIENRQGESVGEINDLVIDGNNGRVRYAAVTYGGVLGVGDKMFAVPFEAFQVKRQAGDADDYVLTLDVTQQRLEGAQGFDQENWPDFADRNFTREIDRRYGIDRRRMRDQIRQRVNGPDRTNVDLDVDNRN
jgi:sporulation protein YlmC with PRC-barrel domain